MHLVLVRYPSYWRQSIVRSSRSISSQVLITIPAVLPIPATLTTPPWIYAYLWDINQPNQIRGVHKNYGYRLVWFDFIVIFCVF